MTLSSKVTFLLEPTIVDPGSSNQLLSHTNNFGEHRKNPTNSWTLLSRWYTGLVFSDCSVLDPSHIPGKRHCVIPLRDLWSTCFAYVSGPYFLGYLASWWRHTLHGESVGLKWAEMRLSSITSPHICSASLIPLSSSLCFMVLGKKCLPSDPEGPAECWGFGWNAIFLKPSSPPRCRTVRRLGHLESVIWIHKYLLHRASACQVSQTQEGLWMH